MPFLSIITIHKNDVDSLQTTLESVLSIVSKSEVEWIVIDGGSELRDTKEIQFMDNVRKFAKQFVSEPDQGIYDAMNKGTRFASGDYILFLNAGDELHASFKLSELIEIGNYSQPDMFWGLCQEKYESGAIVQVKTRPKFFAWYGMPVCHQATFYHRQSLGVDPYDVTFKIAADYDLLCRFLRKDSQIYYLNSVVSVFHRGGVSETQFDLALAEENRVRLKYYPMPSFLGSVIKNFRLANSKLAKISWFRQIWRKWI